MERDAFILSEYLENKESGFYIFNPDFDEVEREMQEEEKELAQKLSEFGIDYVIEEQKQEVSAEEFQNRLKKDLNDPFIYENCIQSVFRVEDEEEGKVVVLFNRPGRTKKYWVTLTQEEIEQLNSDVQKHLLRINPYIFPYLEDNLVKIKDVKFFNSKNKIYVKFVLNLGIDVVYEVEESIKNLLSMIKNKFNIVEEVEEAWEEFQLKVQAKKEVLRAIKKAIRIFKKELVDGYFQYTIKFSEKSIYIFKPRKNKRGEVYYSVFKVLKGDPQLGIPDKVEPLFAVSTYKFFKEWEDLLERR